MKNTIHKIKILLLGILMIATTMVVNPTNVEAETTNGLSKTATLVPGMLNEWEVNLSVKIYAPIVQQDIILVMDRSGSMAGTKLENAKEAANLFVDTLLNGDLAISNRIALISYSRDVTTNQGFTNDKNDLTGKINDLSASGGTFSQGAIKAARDLMSTTGDRPYAEKIIVFLSDGAPTFGYGLSEAGNDYTKGKPFTQISGTSFKYTNISTGLPHTVANIC